jgi:hypothetical protein
MAAYLFGATSCCIAWARSGGTLRRLAALLGALEAGLFLDMVFNGRWLLHGLLANLAIAENLYAERVQPQLAALSLLGAAAAAGMGLALPSLRGRPGASVAVCGAILSSSCWCAEVISLHAFDAAFHAKVKGVMLVSLVWIAGALMTGLGILWEARAYHATSRSDVSNAGAPTSSLTDS